MHYATFEPRSFSLEREILLAKEETYLTAIKGQVAAFLPLTPLLEVARAVLLVRRAPIAQGERASSGCLGSLEERSKGQGYNKVRRPWWFGRLNEAVGGTRVSRIVKQLSLKLYEPRGVSHSSKASNVRCFRQPIRNVRYTSPFASQSRGTQ